MIVLIPLGGIGFRFKELGYTIPKPLINIMGKPILYWLLDNLDLNNIEYVVIPYNNILVKYNFEDRIKRDYKNIKFIFKKLENDTKGAAESIYIILDKLYNSYNLIDQEILCIDGDNFYLENIIDNFRKMGNKNIIYTFNTNSDAFSFLKINEHNNVIDIVEKQRISNIASCGAYGFNSYYELMIYCKYIIDNNIRDKNEFYISTVIKIMIQNNYKFNYHMISDDKYICLGTPLHCRIFCNNFPVINAKTNEKMIHKKRYCFDLDNTLVTYPIIENDYTTVMPIIKNINLLRYLKKLGHVIIIYTARRMRTHNGNIGAIMADIGKITFETLEKFNIPYDEIYFGKPYADYYIDDLAISAYCDLEKELGFYYDKINPRDFNSLSTVTTNIYQKRSNNNGGLSGEIYYYLNIPTEIKDMFPIMFEYDNENYQWYNMERVNGIVVSLLYLSEDLTITQFDNIYNSINRIHNICNIDDECNIYANYIDKLVYRYKNFDYSIFPLSAEVFKELKEYFEGYQMKNRGRKVCIHGDPVFTNIMINQFGKIKMIDMRGKQGDRMSIWGDWLYDWGKLYQSLIGYDEILMDKKVSNEYKNKMRIYFEEKFRKDFGEDSFKDMKMVTKLLLFTLIPLHSCENKRLKYYDRINNIIFI